MPRESLTLKHLTPTARTETSNPEVLSKLRGITELSVNEAELSSEQRRELALAIAQAIGKLSSLQLSLLR